MTTTVPLAWGTEEYFKFVSFNYFLVCLVADSSLFTRGDCAVCCSFCGGGGLSKIVKWKCWMRWKREAEKADQVGIHW